LFGHTDRDREATTDYSKEDRTVNTNDMTVTRYDLEAGLTLGWTDADPATVYIFSADGGRELAIYQPRVAPTGKSDADALLHLLIADRAKRYGHMLWQVVPAVYEQPIRLV